MMKKQNSHAYRTSVLKRLVRYARNGKNAAAEALMLSDEFLHALGRMSDYDRRITMVATAAAVHRVWPQAQAPEPFTVRQTWNDAAIARLRAIAARHGVRPGLDQVIALEMRLSVPVAALARYRYVGRIKAAQPNRKRRRSRFARPSEGGVGSPPIAARDATGKCIESAV